MDVEQILKRLEWLEKQQRRSVDSSSTIEERLAGLERDLSMLSQQSRDLEKRLADFSPLPERLALFEETIARQYREMSALIETLEKNAQQREVEIVKRYQANLDKINQALADLRKTTDVSDIRQQLKDKAIQEVRLTQTLADLQAQIDQIAGQYERLEQAQKAMDEVRRTDAKRLAEVQGDVAALRKRLDEIRDRILLNSDSLRVMENRITELVNSEMERKQAQVVFIEQQLMAQAERERTWKEWMQRAEMLMGQLGALSAQIQAAEEALRAARRAQETYLELSHKLERRINEITEIQRLGEERVRQEWTAFKAEDQKRWTAYSLTQEETLREIRQVVKTFESRLQTVEEQLQRIHDQTQMFIELGQQQLQSLLQWAHEWLTSSEQIVAPEKKAIAANNKMRSR